MSLSKSHIIHQPPQQWANGVVTPIDPLSIRAIRATGWSPDIDELARVPRHGRHFNELRRFLYQIQKHKQARPFLKPVNKDEVPDYYNVITTPMDLSTVEERLKQDYYAAPKNLVNDLKLFLANVGSIMTQPRCITSVRLSSRSTYGALLKRPRSGLTYLKND